MQTPFTEKQESDSAIRGIAASATGHGLLSLPSTVLESIAKQTGDFVSVYEASPQLILQQTQKLFALLCSSSADDGGLSAVQVLLTEIISFRLRKKKIKERP